MLHTRTALICLLLIGLSWIFPTLHYHHQLPITTFYSEWWACLLAGSAFILLTATNIRDIPAIPNILLFPMLLAALVLFQHFAGFIYYREQALLFCLYFLFAAVCILSAAQLRDELGLEKIMFFLAICLLINAEINVVIGFQQLFRWDNPLNWVVVLKRELAIFGNIAQQNHYAHYLGLGLVSLGYICQRKKMHWLFIALLAFPILMAMTLSASRSIWLYLLATIITSFWITRKNPAYRSLLHYSIALLLGLALCHWLATFSFFTQTSTGSSTSIQRTLAIGTSTADIRTYLWREAYTIFSSSPWFGVGFGQFGWHHFQLAPILQSENIRGLYNNAHNIIMQFAAEIGIAGLAILLGCVGAWIYQQYHLEKKTIEHWCGYTLLLIISIHSLLEYPLWYMYFVGITAFLLGLFDESRYRIKLPALGHLTLICVAGICIVGLYKVRQDYEKLENVTKLSSQTRLSPEETMSIKNQLTKLHIRSLFTPYTELFITGSIEVSSEQIESKLALNTRVLHFAPVASAAYNQALLLAQAGKLSDAQTALTQAMWSYPENRAWLIQQLSLLSVKDPSHFAGLLEFANKKYSESSSATVSH